MTIQSNQTTANDASSKLSNLTISSTDSGGNISFSNLSGIKDAHKLATKAPKVMTGLQSISNQYAQQFNQIAQVIADTDAQLGGQG